MRHNQSATSSTQDARRKRANAEKQLEIGRRIMREDYEVLKKLKSS